MNGAAAKGVFVSVIFASGFFLALGMTRSDPSETGLRPMLAQKQTVPPPAGVIGREDRVPLAGFTPEDAARFPGWEEVQDAVVRISCHGGASGGGVLIGEGDRMITAAHVFVRNDGTPDTSRTRCQAVHPSGDRVFIETVTLKSGGFTVPDALGTHFSVAVTSSDWAVVGLSGIPDGARPLPLAGEAEMALLEGQPVLNIAGSQDNFVIEGFLAQVCTYHGAPPTASHLVEGQIVGRPFEPGDEWRVARYDCDLGRGGSGSPIIGWHDGAPYVWGILTDSLRGAPRCPSVARTSCYSAGPLVTAMDIIE